MNVSTTVKGREASWKNAKNAAVAGKRATGTSTSKYSGRKGTRRAQLSDNDEDDNEEDEEETRGHNHKRTSALELVDASADEDDEDDENDSDGFETDARSNHDRRRSRSSLDDSSPEPDVVLAEITHETGPTQTAIPEPLVHKMLHHHFEKPEKTKISTDARDLVGKYLEVFVREAIMRSAFERQERDGDGDRDGGGGGGFLEVEDLERAGVQLCLDF